MDIDVGSKRVEEDVQFDEEQVYASIKSVFSKVILLSMLRSILIFYGKLQVAQLKELSKQPDIYERLTRSLAPNIWELDDVKKGLLCQVE